MSKHNKLPSKKLEDVLADPLPVTKENPSNGIDIAESHQTTSPGLSNGGDVSTPVSDHDYTVVQDQIEHAEFVVAQNVGFKGMVFFILHLNIQYFRIFDTPVPLVYRVAQH
jgi:hypothetical protein